MKQEYVCSHIAPNGGVAMGPFLQKSVFISSIVLSTIMSDLGKKVFHSLASKTQDMFSEHELTNKGYRTKQVGKYVISF